MDLRAVSSGLLMLNNTMLSSILNDKEQRDMIFQRAVVAGQYAAKQTSSMLPLCSNITLSSIDIQIEIMESSLQHERAIKELPKPKKIAAKHETNELCSHFKSQLQKLDKAKLDFKNMQTSNINLMKNGNGKANTAPHALKVRATLQSTSTKPIMESLHAANITLLSLYESLKPYIKQNNLLTITQLSLEF